MSWSCGAWVVRQLVSSIRVFRLGWRFFPPPPDTVCRTQLRSLTAEAVWEPRASNQGMYRLNYSSCIPAAHVESFTPQCLIAGISDPGLVDTPSGQRVDLWPQLHCFGELGSRSRELTRQPETASAPHASIPMLWLRRQSLVETRQGGSAVAKNHMAPPQSVEHRSSLWIIQANTTLAEIFTGLCRAEPFAAVRTARRPRASDVSDDKTAHGG